MEPESSLPHSQQSAICPYPEPVVLKITSTNNKFKVREAEF